MVTYNHEAAAQGIINLINATVGISKERKQKEELLRQEEIKDRRTKEAFERKQTYMNPIDRAFARKYLQENPQDAPLFKGVPGLDVAQRPTSVTPTGDKPTAITPQQQPQQPQRSVELTPSGFKEIKPEDRPIGQLMRKAQETPELLTFNEKKLLSKMSDTAKKMTTEKEVLADVANDGIVTSKGVLETFADKEQESAYITSKLGVDWQKTHPEVNKAFDAKHGPDVNYFKKLIRKNKWRDMTSALNYLVNEVGMTPEKAKQYLRENQ